MYPAMLEKTTLKLNLDLVSSAKSRETCAIETGAMLACEVVFIIVQLGRKDTAQQEFDQPKRVKNV
jgi:hypothetical protein